MGRPFCMMSPLGSSTSRDARNARIDCAHYEGGEEGAAAHFSFVILSGARNLT